MTAYHNTGQHLSGLSSEVVRDSNGNIFFNGSVNEIFVNAAGGDFRLVAGSPAIGMGVPLSEVKTDFRGRPRDPSHPSIGAFEYDGSPSDGPPIVIQDPPPGSGSSEPVPVPTPVVQQEQAQSTDVSARLKSVAPWLLGGLGLILILGSGDGEWGDDE